MADINDVSVEDMKEAYLEAAFEVIEQEPYQLTLAEIEAARRAAYQAEADPIFFRWQRGECEKQEWLDKIAEIKLRFHKPE